MVLNLRNNAFYGIFMPLHHYLGYPNMILEGESFDPLDPPWIRPCDLMHLNGPKTASQLSRYCIEIYPRQITLIS